MEQYKKLYLLFTRVSKAEICWTDLEFFPSFKATFSFKKKW